MMKKKYNLLLLVIPFIFVNCSSKQPEKIDFSKAPKFQKPVQKVKSVRKKGSLYSRQGASLFADKKDLQVGDIIQIQIDESLKSDSNNKRDLSKDSSGTLGGGVFTGGSGLVGKATKNLNDTFNVGFSSTSASTFVGETKTKLNEKFSTKLSAIIEQTYQNGNYYIKGSKEMLIDGQKQEIIISGVIRPYDIESDNSVLSSQIANLKIYYKKDGEENDMMHTPWGLKVLQKIWPF